MGDFSQLSVRRVRCGICGPVGEKTPVPYRAGLLRVRSSSRFPFRRLGLWAR